MTLPLRPPLIVHHMGALDANPVPQNSLEAIRASLEANAAFVEIDVTALASDDYLLVHDPVLESETMATGPVGECALDRARSLIFRYPASATEFRVPVLSEVVRLFGEYPNGARLQIDYKNMIPFADDEPSERFIRLIEPLGERVLVSTGADWQLRRLRVLAPWLDLGFDIHFYIDWELQDHQRHPEAYPRQLGAYGYYDDHPIALRRYGPTSRYLEDRCGMFVGLVPRVSTFYISHHFLVQSLEDGFNWAAALHREGIKCDAWTMDVGKPAAEANAPILLEAGVDQFTTNTPRALAQLLGIPTRS